MFKNLKKLFAKKKTAEQAQAELYNDLAALTLISISLNAGKKK